MAEVWEARALDGTGERVALKRLLSRHDRDDRFRRMFFDEVRIARTLSHDAIARVVDYGLAEGSEFIAFELVDGIDARRALAIAEKKSGAMPFAAALHVAARIARALEHAHAAVDAQGRSLGIVHRDVTPSNVLLAWNGDVKLADFGIAHARDRHHQTASGVVKGKAGYIAPEQALGQPVSPATDAYALGATLHALATGAPPMRDWAEIARRFAGAPLPLAPSLDPRIAGTVRACMEIDPARRPHVGAIADSVETFGATTGIAGRDRLVTWLRPIRDEATRRAPLDDLMDIGLAESSTGPREVTITRPDPFSGPPE